MTEEAPISLPDKAPVDPNLSPADRRDAPPSPDSPETLTDHPAEIPLEKAGNMIDIHPPHHGGITRRDFFIHLFTVILGILIAISLEQTVEYLHHRHLAAEARQALAKERKQNEDANDFNIFATQHHERDLERDLAVLDAL